MEVGTLDEIIAGMEVGAMNVIKLDSLSRPCRRFAIRASYRGGGAELESVGNG